MPTDRARPARTRPARDQAGRARVGTALLALTATVAVFAAVGIAFQQGLGPLPDPEGCSVTVDGVEVDLDLEQAENSSLIAAIAVQRGLPARAVSIALATAYQESKLRNIDYGDRDSLGLFQQRPSQGWGTPEQVMDPYYSINAFYDGLVQVEGYRDMRITEAAQAVQRSGFPEAYEDHAEGGRLLASALTGYSPATFSCTVDGPDAELASQDLTDSGLTPRAEAVRRDVERAFGDLSLGGFEPGGVSTGHMPGSAHYDGRAVDIFFRPITEENRRKGWAVAQYLVANAHRLHVRTVIYDGKIWTSGFRSGQGWRDYRVPDRPGDRAVLEHRDHVHVDVHEDS